MKTTNGRELTRTKPLLNSLPPSCPFVVHLSRGGTPPFILANRVLTPSGMDGSRDVTWSGFPAAELGTSLASVHKCLRIRDLCKELAFGVPRAGGECRFSYNSFDFSVLCRQFLERCCSNGSGITPSPPKHTPLHEFVEGLAFDAPRRPLNPQIGAAPICCSSPSRSG